jgi:hypothetical protein
MLLGITERILLVNALPLAEGNAVFLRAVRRLRLALSFTDQEVKDWKIQSKPNGTFSWDSATAVPVDIEISGLAREYLAGCLKQIEHLGTLNEALLTVYEDLVSE